MLELIGEPLDARFAVICAVVFVGGFMRGFVGFGSALLNVPVLSLAYSPQLAVAVSGLMAVPVMLQLLPAAIRDCEREIVLPAAIAVLLAAPVGTWLLVVISPALMKIVISVLVILMVALLARGWRLPHTVGTPILSSAGAAGGLIQGIAGIGGPPVVAIALSRPGAAVQQRGNILALMSVISISGLLPLWYFGLLTLQAGLIALLLIPVSFLSTWFGSRYFSGDGKRWFRGAALVILAAIGIATLVVSLKQYLAI